MDVPATHPRLRRLGNAITLLSSLTLLTALSGCDSDDGSRKRPTGDAGIGDGGLGGSAGGGGDASSDATDDATSDASSDATSDATLDATLDATADATSDAPDLCEGVVCVASDECHLAGTCDPTTGLCSVVPAADGAPCPCGQCVNGLCGLRGVGGTQLDGQTGTATPVSLAVDTTQIYFGVSYAGVANQAGVGALPVGGGAVTTLAGGFTGYPRVVVAANTVYYAYLSELWSVPSDGSASAALVHTSASPILEVASDGSLLYFISNNGIFSLPLSGGTPTPLAPGEASPASLVASGGRLYWANSSDLTIRSVAVGGGAVSTISSAGSAPGSLDVDASNVYWTEPANGAVQFAPLSGGAAVALATGQQDPRGISVVSGTVYWSNYHGGSVGTVMSAPVSGGLPRQIPGSEVSAPLILKYNGTCMYLLSAGNGFVWSFPPG